MGTSNEVPLILGNSHIPVSRQKPSGGILLGLFNNNASNSFDDLACFVPGFPSSTLKDFSGEILRGSQEVVSRFECD